jgi:hypothetical protein
MALFPTVETRTTSSLRWSCLVVLVGCWGRKASYLVIFDAGTNFLPAGCSDGTAVAAEETTSGSAAAGSDTGAGVLA